MVKRIFRAIFPWIFLIHSLLFLAFWLTNSLFYSQTNDYIAGKTGSSLDAVLICLLAAAGLALWSAARLALDRWGRPRQSSALAGFLYGFCGLIFLAFFYGSFWLLFRESPSQLARILDLVLYFRLGLDLLILVAFVLLAALWLRRSFRLRPAPNRTSALRRAAPGLALLVFLWAVALAVPPGSVYRGELPRQPRLIAHRGASFLAPENTIAAASLAASQGVYGLETDLHISRDGVAFLLHDDTLKRTTDVAAIFPGREKERAEQFSFAEMQRLNAGQWFLQTDPYRTIASRAVSSAQAQAYQRLSVPSLADELEIVRQNPVILIFDLKQPPQDHPYHQQFFDMVFQQIQSAGIDPQIWFLADTAQASLIRSAAPQMVLVHGSDYQHPPQPTELLASGYQVVNADFGLAPHWIQAYQKAGLWVNLYTVDEPWQFSRLWLAGVDSITSSNAVALLALTRPVFALPFSFYLWLWIGLGLLAAGTLAWRAVQAG